jgi:peptidoglycan/xylan/chitin deacetylase (PgdA/CDA1 family)
MIALGLVILVVFVVPYVFIKHLGLGTRRRGAARGGAIGLTFDDGPDPVHTPRVLEILARHGVRATFFVKGDAAEAHPELVRRLVDEGHDVASHGYHHRHALWQRWPIEGFVDTWRGIHRLEELLGRTVEFFRPPWGAHSWTTFFAVKLAGVESVYWTVEAHDWHPEFAPPDVVAKVLAEADAGGIIVMHDGGRGGPRTIVALGGVLRGLRERGLRPVPLSELVR